MNKYAALALANLLAVTHLFAAPVAVQSPNGKITVAFEVKDDALFYTVAKGEQVVVETSPIEIIPKAKMALVDQSETEKDSQWKPVWGQFSTIRDHHKELSLSLTANDLPVTLQCRVFDEGTGFRFVLDEASKGKKLAFSNGFDLTEENGFYHPKGEQGVMGPLSKSELKSMQVPLVAQDEDGSVLALLESDIYSANGFGAMKLSYNQKKESFSAISRATSSGAGQTTPWRTILLGDNIGSFTINTVALNLAAPCKLEDTSWIVPGKGLWDWRVHGYDNGDFVLRRRYPKLSPLHRFLQRARNPILHRRRPLVQERQGRQDRSCAQGRHRKGDGLRERKRASKSNSTTIVEKETLVTRPSSATTPAWGLPG